MHFYPFYGPISSIMFSIEFSSQHKGCQFLFMQWVILSPKDSSKTNVFFLRSFIKNTKINAEMAHKQDDISNYLMLCYKSLMQQANCVFVTKCASLLRKMNYNNSTRHRHSFSFLFSPFSFDFLFRHWHVLNQFKMSLLFKFLNFYLFFYILRYTKEAFEIDKRYAGLKMLTVNCVIHI